MTRRGPLTPIHGHVHLTEAFLLKPVVVSRLGIARLNPCVNKRAVQRIQSHIVSRADRQRAVLPAIRIPSAIPGLCTLVIRQAAGVIPPARASGIPLIDVLGVATHIHHAVY